MFDNYCMVVVELLHASQNEENFRVCPLFLFLESSSRMVAMIVWCGRFFTKLVGWPCRFNFYTAAADQQWLYLESMVVVADSGRNVKVS